MSFIFFYFFFAFIPFYNCYAKNTLLFRFSQGVRLMPYPPAIPEYDFRALLPHPAVSPHQ